MIMCAEANVGDPVAPSSPWDTADGFQLSGRRAVPLPLSVDGAAGMRWRIAERVVDGADVQLTLVQHAPPVNPGAVAGDGGAAQVPGDLPGGTVMLAVFDVPGDGNSARAVPLRLVAAAGSDVRWRGADLWWVSDAEAEPEPFGRISGALALGVLAAPVAAMQTILIDRANAIEVQLANAAMSLLNISPAQLLAGGNRAMLGGEAIQYERATPLGSGRWRLEGLLRGRGGTEDVAGPHAVGTAFVLLDDDALLALPDAMASRAVYPGAAIERQERGSSDMVAHPLDAGARAIMPLSPVHGTIARLPGGGRRVAWIPRSRLGAGWRDGVEVPAGEARTLWRVQYADAAGAPVTRELVAPELELGAGGFQPGSLLSVVQVGDLGVSPPLSLTLG